MLNVGNRDIDKLYCFPFWKFKSTKQTNQFAHYLFLFFLIQKSSEKKLIGFNFYQFMSISFFMFLNFYSNTGIIYLQTASEFEK